MEPSAAQPKEKKPCKACGQIHMKCRAHRKKKNGGGPCGAEPMLNGCCWNHGGNTPHGEESPNFVHGKYVHRRYKIFSKTLAAEVLAAAHDPVPLVLRGEIDLMRGRMQEILNAEAVGAEDLWKAVDQAEKLLTQGLHSGDNNLFTAGMHGLRQALTAGKESAGRWRDVERLALRVRQLAQTETKREAIERTSVSLERVFILMAEVAAIFKEEVHDRITSKRIAERLRKLASSNSSGRSD